MKHETNTYSPVPMPLARFGTGGEMPPEGAAAIAAYRGTGSAIGAFIELAEQAGAEFRVPIAAAAWPSGPVHDAAFEHIAARICAAVAEGCDAVLLDLHWPAGLGALAHAVVECAGTSVCTSDYEQLAFKRVRRPIYPLDPL